MLEMLDENQMEWLEMKNIALDMNYLLNELNSKPEN